MSWDEALGDIAEQVVDTLERDGPGSLMLHAGTGTLSQGRRAAPLRLGSLLGATRLYPSSAVGDLFTGSSLAYGLPFVGHTTDAWFEMDYIVLWGVNPSVTRIPDAHYIWEGRYNKAKVVTISPDYNPTAVHSDQWIPIQPGSDSYLAMTLVHTVFEEGLYKESFVKEQTDLPFLVRRDNGKLLRASDLGEAPAEEDGDDVNPEEIFYFWDQAADKVTAAPGSQGSTRDTLRLGESDPALTGTHTVTDAEGRSLEVLPVFELAREEANRFPPEETRDRTGVHPDVARTLARELAGAHEAAITIGFSIHKYAWGILTNWAQALLCALTAQDTVDTENQWSLGNMGPLVSPKPARFQSGFLGEWFAGHMEETFRQHYDDDETFRRKAGLSPEELAELAKAAVDREWSVHYGEPRVRLMFADNTFRRNKAESHYRDSVLAATDLYVNVNWRLDSSAEWADYVLPAASHYEVWDIRADVGYHRHGNLAVPPQSLERVGETLAEWEICKRLAKHIQKAANKRGLERLEDPELTVAGEDGQEEKPVVRELGRLHDEFTMDGQVRTDKDVVRWILDNVPALSGWKFDNVAERGFLVLGDEAGLTSPLYSDRPYREFERQFYLARPYDTVSGRQQFYIDHPTFQRLGATRPTARESLAQPKFPLRFYSPHTRWGIHSTWRSHRYMLRHQRGVPTAWINPGEARQRGISDGDHVRVYSDVGEFRAMAKLVPSVRPGTLMTDHAWEPHQFPDRKGLNDPIAGLLAPLELAGKWGHLRFGAAWDGNQLAHETTVEIEKA